MLKLLAALALLAAVLVAPGAARPEAAAGGVIVFGCAGCRADPTGPWLYAIRPTGGKPAQVPGTAGGYEPSWSPDGRSVAYSLRSLEIWRRTAAGAAPKRLTRAPVHDSYDQAPDWSPDGRTILFVRLAPGQSERRTSFWRMPARGGPAAKILEAPVNVVYPDWSPDGRSIAFSDARERLWIARADGSHRRGAAPPAVRGRAPKWSPDGTRVAFFDFDSGALRLLDLRSGRARTLNRFGSESLACSPDGSRLAVARTRRIACREASPYECRLFEIAIVRVRDGSTRVIYESEYGEPYGLDWR